MMVENRASLPKESPIPDARNVPVAEKAAVKEETVKADAKGQPTKTDDKSGSLHRPPPRRINMCKRVGTTGAVTAVSSLKPEVAAKLMPYQPKHVEALLKASLYGDVVFDGSDTGTGKTYAAIARCAQSGLRPFIVCPKVVISVWAKVCVYFGVVPLAIVNYETVRTGKQYADINATPLRRVPCKYVKADRKAGDGKMRYEWKVPENAIVIWDEVHKCKNPNSMNGRLLLSCPVRSLLLSATLCDRLGRFAVFGKMLNLFNTLEEVTKWEKELKAEGKTLHDTIFPKYGARMKKADHRELFQKNTITAELFDIDEKARKEVDEAYTQMRDIREEKRLGVEALTLTSAVAAIQEKEKTDKDTPLVRMLRERQRVELIRIPLLAAAARESIAKGESVIIFVNFQPTMDLLMRLLRTTCVVRGDQKFDEREACIAAFQSNKERVILCNNQAGGVGISLHDLHGGHPRVAIHSPSFSSEITIQCFGRADRAGAKTEIRQRLIFCRNTIEESICRKVQKKIGFVSTLNDGDLTAFNIEGIEKIGKD